MAWTFWMLLAICVSTSYSQYLPGLTDQASQLSTFFQLLNETSSGLYALVEQGNVTILAPTNDAWSASSSRNASHSELDALLRYHVLQGIHASPALSGSPAFMQTLLQNSSYTNETGGQYVQALGVNGVGTIVSGHQQASHIFDKDVFFLSGYVHSIDTVLEILEQYGQTVTAANLTGLLALTASPYYSSASNQAAIRGFQIWPDVTSFAPNSSGYTTALTTTDSITEERYHQVWNYHLLNGTTLFSTEMANGSSYETAAGLNVTVWKAGDDLYVNDAKIIGRDILHANGVIQALEK